MDAGQGVSIWRGSAIQLSEVYTQCEVVISFAHTNIADEYDD